MTTLLLPAVLISCHGSTLPPRDTVVVALSAPAATLDPRRATDATGSRLAGLLFSALVRIDDHLQPTGDAASEWHQDGENLIFKLKPGLKFSNGRALTGEDIEFSFQQAMDAKSAFASSFNGISSVKAQYNETAGVNEVRLKVKKQTATLISDLVSIKFLPKAEILSGQIRGDEIPSTGPFSLESVDANEIRMRARKDHPYWAPMTAHLIFKIIRDDQTRTMKIKKGEIDLAQQELPALKIAQVEKQTDLQVWKYPGLSMSYLLLNLEDPWLKQFDARRAIAMSIHRDDIIHYALSGLGELATSLLTPTNPFFNADLKPIGYAPDEARRLLKNLQTPEGNRLSLKTSNSPAAIDNGRLIAHDIAQIGVNVQQTSFEWGTFYADIQNGRFQMATMRWVGTIDPDLYRKAFHSTEQPPKGRNRGHYRNSELDALMDQGANTLDFNQRKEIYNKIQATVLHDLPIIPLWYDEEVAVANRRLKGYIPPRNGEYWILTQVSKDE